MKLLVVINNHNSFGLLDFCTGLKRIESTIEVVAACSQAIAQQNGQRLRDAGVTWYIVSPSAPPTAVSIAPDSASASQTSPASGLKKLAHLARRFPFYMFARELLITKRLEACKKYAREIFRTEKPDVVLSISDRSHDYVEGPILWEAKRSGVPVVIPFVAHYDVDSALEYRKGADGIIDRDLLPFSTMSLYKLLSYLRFKKQMYKGVFFQPTFILNANRRAGTLSAYPWWAGNGLSDVVCVDSRHTAEKFAFYGVDRRKIAVTGHVAYDRVYASFVSRQERRNELIAKYSLPAAKALLVFSMPQYAEQGYMTWEQHWEEIEAITQAITSCEQNVLISLHPRSERAKYQFLENRYGCHILDEPLADIIGTADIFLASNSSTFAWAALCGIHSLAVRSPVKLLFTYLQSVRPVYDHAQIAAEISKLLTSARLSFEQDWFTLSRDEVFNGRFSDRFLNLLKNARSTAL